MTKPNRYIVLKESAEIARTSSLKEAAQAIGCDLSHLHKYRDAEGKFTFKKVNYTIIDILQQVNK